jgi:hypothetical protein
MTELTQAIVHELPLYDPFAGQLTWRKRDRKWFKSERACILWNATYADRLILPCARILTCACRSLAHYSRRSPRGVSKSGPFCLVPDYVSGGQKHPNPVVLDQVATHPYACPQ